MVAVLAIACPSASAQAPAPCPGSFEVLHYDQIGALELTPGPYSITVLDQAALTCADAPRSFSASSSRTTTAGSAAAGG